MKTPQANALAIAALGICVLGASTASRAAISLEQIMQDPDWIGPPVESPYWSVDGKSIYYSLKRTGSSLRDLHVVSLGEGRDAVVDGAAQAQADGPDAVFDKDRKRAAFIRHGDVFMRDAASGKLTQLTRTSQQEAAPRFSQDGRFLRFRANNDWYSYDIEGGIGALAAVVRLDKDPDKKKPDTFEEMQLRLSSNLKRDRDDREAKRKREDELSGADRTRLPAPIYLGDDVAIGDTSLSPNGRWLVVVTQPKGFEEGRTGKMPRYVTESGYEEVENVRTRVEKNGYPAQRLYLVDLESRALDELETKGLPGIADDPLAAIRAENDKARKEREAKEGKADAEAAKDEGKDGKDEKSGKEAKDGKDEKSGKDKRRPVRVSDIVWSDDGNQAAITIDANDNKDRWIVSLELAKHAVVPQHRDSDAAWVNWKGSAVGWTADSKSLFFLSEETGFSHLYLKPLDGKATALTSGEFEVENPVVSPDGKWFYVLANQEARHVYDVYRVASAGGKLERVSSQKGIESFALAPDGATLLVAHSASYTPRQLSVLAADGQQPLRALTDTRTAAYKAMRWQEPEIVSVPSTHVKQAILSKLYRPAATFKGPRPIVMFVHGAGYTQNTHLKFPYYFREQMFHNLLTERGYLVLDMDYRASEGYGRDWRTAIYRQMGHPELEDLIDGVNWLVKKHNGDARRVGLYGGSYGGFMTLMALFRAPEVFKTGAALRPVTDWTQYGHEYTSAILNTPSVDDIAYRRSSPIEFAGSLKGPLLIAHGMVDDNVFFQDSVRLFQRLIELKKDNVELAPYPLEAHGFHHPESWRDEYARILKLFEAHLNSRP